MEKSTKGNAAQFSKQTAAFKAAFSEEIVEGNTYEIIYIPGEGIIVTKGNKEVKSIPCGLEFKKAVFGIGYVMNQLTKILKKVCLTVRIT